MYNVIIKLEIKDIRVRKELNRSEQNKNRDMAVMTGKSVSLPGDAVWEMEVQNETSNRFFLV